MKRVLSSTLAILLASISGARADFTFTHNGHTYEVITTPASWTAAAADATSRDVLGLPGYLTHIDDATENTAIFNQLQANIGAGEYGNTTATDGGGAAYVWTGATDRATEGSWLWDGDNSGAGSLIGTGQGANGLDNWIPAAGVYNNWGSGSFTGGAQAEPDDFNGAQDAAGIALTDWPNGSGGGLGNPGQWNDVNETNTLYYIVEFNDVVPEPASALLLLLGSMSLSLRRSRRS